MVHVRNDMPGEISLKVDQPNIAGLKITLGKTQLMAHEETTILFEWRLDDPAIKCLDCAKKMNSHVAVQLHVIPTGQVFPIGISISNASSTASAPVSQK